MQTYRLTSAPVAKAIVDAHRRGVRVTILLDRTQQSAKYSDATYFHNQGMAVLIDRSHAIAHNKVMIVDGTDVITRSFNFSAAAETSNAENRLVIHSRPLVAAAYAANFEAHRRHCEPYRPPTGTAGGGPETRPAAGEEAAGGQASATDEGELRRARR